MANRTSLASAIRTAATQVSGASTPNSPVDKNYASSRIGLGLGPSVTRALIQLLQLQIFIRHSSLHHLFKFQMLVVRFIFGLTGGEIMNLKLLQP